MKTTRIVALSLLTAAMTMTGLAHAESTVTRAQVLAEAAQALRTGDVIDYETGRKLNELFPGAYPKAVTMPVVQTLSKPAQPTAANEIGDLEYDLIAQRNAQAIARRSSTAESNQVAVSR